MKYEKITCASLAILILLSSTAIPTSTYNTKKGNNVQGPGFTPENITLQDDAFHTSSRFFHLETWYFDAKFTNNQSVVIVICLLQIHNSGIILHGFYLYNNSSIQYADRKITRFKNCDISYDHPSIIIDNLLSIEGWIDAATEQWRYSLKYSHDDLNMDLLFTKTANGWMGEHELGWWLAIPHFSVNGSIVTHDKEMQVSGRGYHDHNIYPLYVPFITNGYHFGSFGGDLLQITWARIETKQNTSELFAILSKDEINFSIIDPSAISFQIIDTMYDHGTYIPKTCRLSLDSDTVQANLTIDTITTHFIKATGLKYWRYHLHVSGFINTPSHSETIDSIEISELLRFI